MCCMVLQECIGERAVSVYYMEKGRLVARGELMIGCVVERMLLVWMVVLLFAFGRL